MSETTDHDLVRAFQAGRRTFESEPFQTLYERHKDRVYNICYRLTGNHADALDASQETFLNVFRKLGGFRCESRFSTWLHRVAVNASHDLARRGRRCELYSPGIRPMAAGTGASMFGTSEIDLSSPADEVSREDIARKVQAALCRLPAALRATVVLRYVEGLSYLEVAAALGISVGTVKSRMHRALAALEDRLLSLRAELAA